MGTSTVAEYSTDEMLADLGRLVGHLQSLEFFLRTFLFIDQGLPFMKDMDAVVVGETLDENPMTDWRQLKQLVKDYNAVVEPKAPALVVLPIVADIRDALAHGRVYARKAGAPARLLRFSKPKNGKVQVENADTLDRKTLGKWSVTVFAMLDRVLDARKRFQ
jgi:hypothetical protein